MQEYQDNNLNHEDRIVLKPIAGIKPTIYIPVLYVLVILLVLSFMTYRALVHNEGSYLSVTSTPAHASVIIDGTYIGATPLKVLQKKGTHKLQVSLPFFQDYQEEYHSSNPLIKFLAVKKRDIILIPEELPIPTPDQIPDQHSNQSLTATAHMSQDSKNLVDYIVSQVASWNNANTQSTRNIIPPILDEHLQQLIVLLQDDITPQDSIAPRDRENIMYIMFEILYQVLPYLSNSKDIATLSNEESIWLTYYEKITQLDVYNQFITNIQSHKTNAYKKAQIDYYYQYLLNKTKAVIKESPYLIPQQSSPIQPHNLTDNATESLTLQGLRFTKIPSQTIYYKLAILSEKGALNPIHSYMEFVPSDEFMAKALQLEPQNFMEIQVPNFYIMNTEITQAHYQTFLEDRGLSIDEWRKKTAHLVEKDYQPFHFLDFQEGDAQSPLRYITWYDAISYIEWLNEKLADTAYRAELPNEYYWNAAIQQYPQVYDLEKKDTYVPRITQNSSPELIGSLWEWGASWYSPNPQHATFDGPLYGSEKHIFGGSYITKKNQKIEQAPIYLSRNTAAPPTWANEFIGFRVILVNKN